ncbi:unnamed protein product [Cylindrotheca closterium]|uniref:Kinesin light chain n=1 Tax=Cylindrotheca closterium TaxID=2856 RepID=A0AAD2PXE3_9STRA|nr:unnamed protein product [Cylindrotheca closterium]
MEENEEESVEELLKKASLQVEQHLFRESREILERVLEIQTQELGEDDLAVASTLSKVGSALKREGFFDEAVEKLNRALAIRMGKLGRHVDTADTYIDIAGVLEAQNKDEQAEEILRKALDIKLELFSDTHPGVTAVYRGLTFSLQKQGKLSEAIKMHKQELTALLQLHGEEHPSVVMIYTGISGLLKLQDRLDDALQMIDRAIEICSRLQGLGNFDKEILGATLGGKARILEELGNIEAATETLNKRLVIQIETSGEIEPMTALIYNDLARVYVKQNMMEAGIKAYMKSISVFEETGCFQAATGTAHNLLMVQMKTVGEMHLTTAQTYEHLARLYIEQDMMDAGVDAYMKAIVICKTVLGDDHPRTKELVTLVALCKSDKHVSALNEKGLAMKKQGDSEKAIQFFQQALHMYEQTSVLTPSAVEAYENLSAVKADLGLLQDAIAASAEALKIRRRASGDEDPATERRMKLHRSLLKRLLESRS